MADKYPVRITAAPKVGSLYWCSLHPENVIQLPEFWKKRPVVIISRKNTLKGKVVVLPITTDDDNQTYENSIELSEETRDKINGKRCWVVCDHPITVATSRLDYVHKNPPRIDPAELGPILEKCHSLIAGWVPPPKTLVTVEETVTVTETATQVTTEIKDKVSVSVQAKPTPGG